MQRHPLDPLVGQSLLGVPELTPLPAGERGIPAELRVLVVATDPVVRSAFAQRIARHAVGQASPQDVVAQVERVSANAVLWDMGPDEAVDAALAAVPVPVVALTSTPLAASRLVAAGANGVVRRDASVEAISGALSTVRHGLHVVDPTLHAGRSASEARLSAGEAPTESLTPREIQVLELVATGMSNKQIARELGISAHTVKFHVNAILGKLDVHTRTQAVVRGVQLGLMTV